MVVPSLTFHGPQSASGLVPHILTRRWIGSCSMMPRTDSGFAHGAMTGRENRSSGPRIGSALQAAHAGLGMIEAKRRAWFTPAGLAEVRASPG
jgi:hypothetical protein